MGIARMTSIYSDRYGSDSYFEESWVSQAMPFEVYRYQRDYLDEDEERLTSQTVHLGETHVFCVSSAKEVAEWMDGVEESGWWMAVQQGV